MGGGVFRKKMSVTPSICFPQLIQEYSGFHPSTVQIDTGGHALSVFCIKFHPDQPDVMLTGGWDDTVKVRTSKCRADCKRRYLVGDVLYTEC